MTLSGVTVSGVISGSKHVGALIAKSYTTGTVSLTNCDNNASVSSSNRAGGLVGTIQNYNGFLTVTGCSNTGAITSSSNAGGIIAAHGGSILVDDCHNSGAITTGKHGAGLLGGPSTSDSKTATIKNSSNSGSIRLNGADSNYCIAGLAAGSAEGNEYTSIVLKGTISSTGAITITDNSIAGMVGGVIGHLDCPATTEESVAKALVDHSEATSITVADEVVPDTSKNYRAKYWNVRTTDVIKVNELTQTSN